MRKVFWAMFLLPFHVSAQETDSVVTNKDSILVLYCPTNPVIIRYVHPTISERAATTLTQCFDGAVPGLQATNGGGQPGALPELLIRGLSTLVGSNAPMLVVNGAPYFGNIAALNIHDVSSVTILKDAISTIAYGSRSANGVLEIVTKEKNDYKNRLNVDVRSGIVTRGINDYKTLDAKDYYETFYDAAKDNIAPGQVVSQLGGYNAFNVPDDQLFTPDGKINPSATLKYNDNWTKETQRVAFKQDYNVSFSGNGKKGRYYLGAGYLNEDGYVKHTSFERFNATFNGELKISSWLKAGIFSTGAFGTQHFIAEDDISFNNPFFVGRAIPSIYPVYYRNAANEKVPDPVTGTDKFDWGNKSEIPESSMGYRPFGQGTNVAGALELDSRKNKLSSILASPYIEATFFKQLSIRTSLHYNLDKNKQYISINPYNGIGAPNTGVESSRSVTNKIYTWDQVLTWKPNYQNHNINITAGHENFRYDGMFNEEIRPSNGMVSTAYERTLNKLEGYYLNGAYNYKEKYYLSAGLRRDGIAYFSPSKNWNNNWAIGAAYQISNESFLEEVHWINTLKLRVNYGIFNNAGLMPSPDAKSVKHFNAGIDFIAFANRLNITLDIYNKNSPGYYLTPGSPSGPKYFLADMQTNNKGIELSAVVDIIRTNRMLWATRLNITHNKNRITSSINRADGIYQLKEGNSLYDFFLPEYAGVDPQTGMALYYYTGPNGQRTATSNYDLITPDDYKHLGSALPKVYGSLTNMISYKQFDFSLQLNYSLGGKYYDGIYQQLMGSGFDESNWSTDILNRWTPTNPSSDIPRVNVNDMYANGLSSRFIRDASYLNIKSLYVGYNFPLQKIKKARLQSLKIYLTADNLWLFTASRGMNPQATFNGRPGYVYIPSRTIMLGINVGL